MDEVDSLVGDIGSNGTSNEEATQNGALNAVSQGVDEANEQTDKDSKEVEREQIKKKWAEYESAREFDKAARQAYMKDRQYAAGTNDPSWASDANLIGAFIDILTSFLYAKNPDVSCRAAEQVGDQPNDDNTNFAQTLELIVARLWYRALLKRTIKKQVRSTLTVGAGWFKAIMWSQKRPQPQVEKTLRDAEEQVARIQATAQSIQDDVDATTSAKVKEAELQQLITGLRAKTMLARESGMNVDFARAEDIQVSLDVSSLDDYLSANWVSEDMYILKRDLKVRFNRLTEDDISKAVKYYQKSISPAGRNDTIAEAGSGDDSSDGTYSKSTPSNPSGGNKPAEFVKVVELWDRSEGVIMTMCDGIEVWCVEPFPPPQASTRFYPYFFLEFFPVDGSRHPQSLVFRLRKLQDEYAACRSNQRLTRERAIPGIVFNRGLLSQEDADKIQNSVIAESIGVQLTDITMPLQNAFMAKPLPTIDPRLWDSSSIRQDMEAVSGVQEALQQNNSQQPKTATEAQIQQTGFASRTGADRDALEEMLDDFAKYTAETAIQEVDANAAQRIAGPLAFWPAGMDVQDLLTMVNVDLDAGTTGKPDLAADKANWGVLLPLLQKMIVQIRQVQGMDPPLAKSLQNLLGETLRRLDDRLDLTDFIATDPPPPPPAPPKPQPAISIALKGDLPVLDAAVIGANAAGLPPEAIAASGGVGAPPSIKQGAPDHPGSHIADGDIPLHPHMPEPLPAAKETPAEGGKPQAAKS